MYNPSAVGKKGSIFGLPYNLEESDLVFFPVHLDVTVSYGQGTSKAPDIILEESSQLDLSLLSIKNPWELKMAMYDRVVVASQNEIQRGRAINIIKALEAGKEPEADQLAFVNEYCETTHLKIEETAASFFDLGKLVGVIGGDHSSPLGLIRALAKKKDFGILQIDAHMDLRASYEGFTYSHASIMYNALKESGVKSLTQVGIRDYCEEEEAMVSDSAKPIHVFFDEHIYNQYLDGVSLKEQVRKIVDTLPQNVYVSFDMDGLDPSLCPKTGTPVPGGLQFNQAVYLLEEVVQSGRKIIGFDVCETGDDSWDANVAARIIYRLAALTGVSNDLLYFR
ncbi:agmatinase family protein [Ekhidna sp. MALMAid0563]|uniref:agmatinase family protein n=1 Tax=Ekhidna sp. MALMAid0563 TaxID=3143937 RepID=UPI0032DF1CA9